MTVQTAASAAYIVAALLFILALAGLSRHETARFGNTFGIAGMAIALVATLVLAISGGFTALQAGLLIGAMVIGAAIGLYRAARVPMTGMPELIALFHSFVGLAAVLVGWNGYLEVEAGDNSGGGGGVDPDARTEAVDLQEGLDVARASMHDYAERVERSAEVLPRPVAICAWSMGGLVAMMAAQRVEPDCLVLLEPSPPAEIQGTDPDVELDRGTFDGEASYGAFPAGVRSRPESRLARAERKRGISVARLAGPALVISGREFAMERGRLVAERYGCDEVTFPELDHWGLVLDVGVPDVVAQHLAL